MPQHDECPKRARMSVIRAERRHAGFCEVNVWLPVEFANVFRALAWRIIGFSPVELPHRGVPRSSDADASDLSQLKEIIEAPGEDERQRDRLGDQR